MTLSSPASVLQQLLDVERTRDGDVSVYMRLKRLFCRLYHDFSETLEYRNSEISEYVLGAT